MKYIDRLLQGAPVEWRPLGEVFEMRNGYTPSKSNPAYWEGGTIPWFRMEDLRTSGRILEDSIQHITPEAVKGKGLFKAGSILMATTATIGEHALLIADSLANQRFTNCKIRESLMGVVTPIFAYYYFFLICEWCKRNVYESSFPSVDMKRLREVRFPIPPVAVQEEVVRILDKFTALEAELEVALSTELDCRKRQYQYYRDSLLTFDLSPSDGLCHSPLFPAPFAVEWRPLGEVATKVDKINWGASVMTEQYEYIDLSSIDVETSQITDTTVISSTNHPSRAQQIIKTNDILFGTTRPTLMRCCLIPQDYDNQICSTGYCVIRPDTSIIHPHLIYHVISSSAFRDYVERFQVGASYPSISDKLILSYSIPIPPLAVQERIVEILDKFDTLVNSISEGLPREIALRRKQYEYYRDALLSF